MKIWKVYAQCVIKVNPVKEIFSIDEALDDLFNFAMENDLIDFDEDNQDEIIGNFYSEKKKEFEKYGFLECGDYEVVKSDEMPERPNKCGYDV